MYQHARNDACRSKSLEPYCPHLFTCKVYLTFCFQSGENYNQEGDIKNLKISITKMQKTNNKQLDSSM